MSNFLPTKYEQILLVCGWCKNHTKANIPEAICHLFFKFYSTNICMAFKGEKLKQFLNQGIFYYKHNEINLLLTLFLAKKQVNKKLLNQN